MATYKQVGYGSQGSDVKTLQQMLNSNGYKLDVDGIFGSKTQAAVKDYQQKNKLAVDGIVGKNTWGSLTSGTENKAKAKVAAPVGGDMNYAKPQVAAPVGDMNYGKAQVAAPGGLGSDFNEAKAKVASPIGGGNSSYQKGDAVTKAEELIRQQLGQKPGEYQSTWQNQLDEAMKKILNREEFSYDLNGDALYQQYKDQYMMQGQQAMLDTMGQAQAMTGGYGNSYAQSVGQQAYQGHLQQLNDIVPELYQMALDKYRMEGEDLYNQYGILADREDQDYGRYRDQLADWNSDRDFYYNQYQDERNFDYNKYQDDRNFKYQQDRDAVQDQQWQDQFQYQQDRDKIGDQQWQSQFDYQKERDQIGDQQWLDAFQYQKDRDQIGDQQWQDQFDYQKDRDQIGDQQWQDQFQYQKDRDQVDDEQWQKEFDEAKRRYDQEWEKENPSKKETPQYDPQPQPQDDPQPQPQPQPSPQKNPEQSPKPGPNDGSDGNGGTKTTYEDVVEMAAQLRKKGASKNDIYQYLSSVINSPDYVPNKSVQQDLKELVSGYVGIGR